MPVRFCYRAVRNPGTGSAGKPDVPGLFVSRGCTYFWQTVPYLPRDVKRVEDVDSSGADHAADAARYGCLREERVATLLPLWY